MRLYNKAEFLKLPANTIYSRVDKDKASLISGLHCKLCNPNDGWTNDWLEQELIGDGVTAICPESTRDGSEIFLYGIDVRDAFKEFKLDYWNCGRDGMFDETDKFVVWNDEDIAILIRFLQNCLSVNKQP